MEIYPRNHACAPCRFGVGLSRASQALSLSLSLFRSLPLLHQQAARNRPTGNRQSAWPLVLHDAGRESPPSLPLPERRAVARTAVARGYLMRVVNMGKYGNCNVELFLTVEGDTSVTC